MADQGMFRTSLFGGFNRKDVLRYVDALAGKYREQTDAVAAQLEQLQAQKAGLERDYQQLQQDYTGLQTQAAARQQEIADLTEKMQELAQRHVQLQDEYAAVSASCEELQQVTGHLRAQNAQMQADILKLPVVAEYFQALQQENEMLKQQLDQLRHNAYTPPDAVIAGSAAQPPYEETPGSAAQDVSTQTDVGHCPAEQSVSAAPAETSEQASSVTDQQPSAGAVSEPSKKAASPTVANPDGTQSATDASDADMQQKNQFTGAWRRVVPAQQADAAVEQTAGQPAADTPAESAPVPGQAVQRPATVEGIIQALDDMEL